MPHKRLSLAPLVPDLKYYPFLLTLSFALMVLSSCNRGEKKDNQQDTSLVTSSEPVEVSPEEWTNIPGQIDYPGADRNEIRSRMETFLPFEAIRPLIERSISIRDSLVNTHVLTTGRPPLSLKDSLLFRPYEIKAYAALLEYQNLIASGFSLRDKCPDLLELTRNTSPNDSSIKMLPEAKPSALLSSGEFFFIGGAPFMQDLNPEDKSTFTDAAGNPEVRYINNDTENGNFILNSIYHFKTNDVTVTFGKPLRSYYGYLRDVNGVGSLIHQFTDRIPVFFITESEIVPAHIISVKLNLVPKDLGCQSDQPSIEFACARNIGAAEILGIYIPYTSATITSCKVTRKENKLWTADLNTDGIADVACVSSSSFGPASGSNLARAIWFVNINGEWKIIDYASEYDCISWHHPEEGI